jgi:hypothetical protein
MQSNTAFSPQVKEEKPALVLNTNASIVNELLEAGRITEEEAERLLYVSEEGR